MTREFLTKLRKLGENYYGNKLYGEHLQYQHELQDLIERYTAEKVLEARSDELSQVRVVYGRDEAVVFSNGKPLTTEERRNELQAELSKLKEEE